MKFIKKIAGLLLAAVVVLNTTVIAHADDAEDGYTITINNSKEGHIYEAYQIFTGDLYQGVLSNIVWGDSVANAAALGNAADIAARMDAEYAADDKITAADLIGMITLSDDAYATSGTTENPYVISGLEAGYYLVKDQDASQTGDHDAYTSYILQVVESVAVSPKSTFPTVDKEVWDESADGETAGESWGETADHNIMETFQFKLTAKLPASEYYADYETYKLVFNDTMSDGVTFEKLVSVTVDGVAFTADRYACTAAANQAGGTWSLTLDNIKVAGVDLSDGAVVEVIYDAHLNENAVVGNQDDNKNSVYLQYSNNPNAGGEGDLGQTEEDTVWVFTYELDVTKVDGKDNTKKLADARFVLYREISSSTDNASGDNAGEAGGEGTGGDSGNTGEGTGGAEGGNADSTVNVTKEYVTVDSDGRVSSWTEDKNAASTLISGTDGLFKVLGLDHGTYYLEEIKAPAGYNLLKEPVEVVISAAHKENSDTVSAETVITVNGADAIVVENNAGATLPETGGIGTTIFYMIGAVLVLGAVVLLITRRRMAG